MPDRRSAYPRLLAEQGLPVPGDATMDALRDIVDEGVLGASNHVALALPLVVTTAEAPRPTARDEALALASFISATRGAGAPIVANALAWLTEGVAELPREAAAARLRERAGQWDALAKARRARLVSRAAEALRDRRAPLIYDYSSTAADVVRALAAQSGLDRLVIPESRAIDGGRRYMQALADLGVPILFLPDAALEQAAARSDVVLLGAESVTRDGGVVNTVGSVLAARAAQARGVPVYGAADLFKVGRLAAGEMPPFEPRRYDFLLAQGEAASTEAPELETVPPALIEAILTEEGPLPPARIAPAAAAAGAAPDRVDA
jgi:translation initiation factor 2B subunit (eIF-2B alpha/beta/delta family)